MGDDFHFTPHAISLHENDEGYFFLSKTENEYGFINSNEGFAVKEKNLKHTIRYKGSTYFKNQFEENIFRETKFPKLSSYDYFNIKKELSRGGDTCNIITGLRDKKSIEFLFKNVRYTGNNKYIEFDINAKVNTPGLKFGKGNLYVRYTSQFGKYAITNNTLEVTKGTIIQNSIYNLTSTDLDSNVFRISILPSATNNNLYTLTGAEEQLAHVKIKISDFTSLGSLSFDDIDISGEVFYWCQGSYNLFDETNLSEPITAVNNNSGNAIGIKYTFENVLIDLSSNEMTIDLYAEATSVSKFAVAFIYINYNELGFGSNIFSNGNFTFYQDDLLDNTNVYFVKPVDHDNNTILLQIYSLDPDPSLYEELNTTPRKMGNMTFKIINCDVQKNLSFDPLTNSPNHNHYTGVLPLQYEVYNPVIATDEETGTICGCKKPKITSFSPLSIHGGLDEILTINGTDFGSYSPPHCKVVFKNGDDDSNKKEILNGTDDLKWDGVYHWSDTKIQLKVPSTDFLPGTSSPASTGKIKVRNICDESDESNSILEIPYSIINFRKDTEGPTKRLNLKANNPNNSICFSFSDALPDWIYLEFINALDEWCSETSINFTVGNIIDNDTAAVDDVNNVSYILGSGGGMVINSLYYGNSCSFQEIDFQLKTTITNPSDQDKANMREIIMHEIGHAHMLEHSRGLGQIMQPNGNASGYISSDDKEGANLVFASSAACGSPSIGSGLCKNNCGSTNSILDLTRVDEYKISPNPTTENVELELIDIDLNKINKIIIYNVDGKILNSFTPFSKKFEIKLPDLPNMYFIEIQKTDGLKCTQKIVKL